MQYQLLALAAFATSVVAAPPANSNESLLSIASVLQTALPSSLVAEAQTNAAAASSEIVSEFAAGQTPGWFASLPSDIQTYLIPVPTNSGALSNATVTANATALSSAALNTTVSAGTSSSSISTASSATLSGPSSVSGGSGSSESSSGSPSSSSTGGASMPTALVGAGLAGAVGIVGLLAL